MKQKTERFRRSYLQTNCSLETSGLPEQASVENKLSVVVGGRVLTLPPVYLKFVPAFFGDAAVTSVFVRALPSARASISRYGSGTLLTVCQRQSACIGDAVLWTLVEFFHLHRGDAFEGADDGGIVGARGRGHKALLHAQLIDDALLPFGEDLLRERIEVPEDPQEIRALPE
jgi:hypothetical protein